MSIFNLNIRLDIQDGVRLINFFELLSGKRAKGYDATPKNRINKINNLSIALNFLERDMFVSNPGCCAEGFYYFFILYLFT